LQSRAGSSWRGQWPWVTGTSDRSRSAELSRDVCREIDNGPCQGGGGIHGVRRTDPCLMHEVAARCLLARKGFGTTRTPGAQLGVEFGIRGRRIDSRRQ
jgi:hypothetical protein